MTRRVSRRRLLSAVALGLVPLSGCGYRPGGGDPRWRSDDPIDGFGGIDAVYAPTDGVIALSRSSRRFDFDRERWLDGGVVAAYDPTTGAARGTVTTEPILRDCADETGVYLGTRDALVAVGPDGTQRWQTALDAPPAAVDGGAGRVVVLDEIGTLRAFRADGRRLWQTSIPVPSGADGATGDGGEAGKDSPTGASELDATLGVSPRDVVVQVATEPPRVVAFDPDGRRRWVRRGRSFGPGRGVRPVVADGRVLLTTTDALRSVAVEDGTDQWTTDSPPPRDVVVRGDTCYTRIRARVTARSLDGRRRWAFDGADAPGRGRFVAGPVATDDGVFAATGEHLFAVTTGGAPRWRVPIAERPRQLALTAELVVRATDRRLVGHWQRDQF
ncbi:hypothetical protein [Salinigranum salinum]|uniref:hypothetical protein n=1 Tax=Salinigranum salinum TaxID=1364937 RepID=UPI001260958E|nr:hypothetical protein [Salinigranum salinum]